MNKTQAGRLLTLAWYLRTEVNPERFDMGSIAVAYSGSEFVGPFNEHPCGTSACALGYASNIWPDEFQLTFRHGKKCDGLLFRGQLVFLTGPEVRRFFGVGFMEACRLFYADDSTPKRKAAQIEKLVGEHGWEYADV